MKDIDYATAVARVKFNETKMLDNSDIDRLIGAKSTEEAAAILGEKGFWGENSDSESAPDPLHNAWELIREIAPDFSEFHFLLVKNDYHNLKAVLKGTVTGKDYTPLCVSPVITPADVMAQAIDEQRWSLLPQYMQITAKAAYDFFVNTGDGQLSDICIDKGALDAVVLLSKDNKDAFIRELGDLIAVSYNLRIAVRCAKLNMNREFIEQALCDKCSVDAKRLSETAVAGLDELCAYIGTTKYSDAAKCLEQGVAEFEKWCDNALINYVEKARFVSFTAAPLAAYIVKKEAEVKTVRIIMSGKSTNLSDEQIRQRIRRVY